MRARAIFTAHGTRSAGMAYQQGDSNHPAPIKNYRHHYRTPGERVRARIEAAAAAVVAAAVVAAAVVAAGGRAAARRAAAIADGGAVPLELAWAHLSR